MQNLPTNSQLGKHGTYPAGIVAQLWRYPVKSLRGEQCESITVNTRGVESDRLFALRDINGKFGSGKTTNRFLCIDGLLGFQAVYEGNVPIIFFPDGRILRGDNSEVHTALSRALGQPVTLAPEAATSHLDAGPVHLLTTASLAWLQAGLLNVSIDERRFRPNLLIDLPGVTQVERSWLGKILAIGEAVRLRVCESTERCGMVASEQADLPYNSKILEFLSQEADLHFGVYAEVLAPGEIKRGDSVTVLD